jgi:mono/diheme cytochrome c family protein
MQCEFKSTVDGVLQMKTVNHRVRRWLTAGPLLSLTAYIFSSNALSAPAVSGADLFKSKCAMCHGPDGAGNTPAGQRMKVRDLRSPEVQKQTDDELTSIITNGKPPMPGYGKTLQPADIQQLVTYLRSIARKS